MNLLYTDKLENVIEILKQLTNNVIFFTEYKDEILDEIDTITGCVNNEEGTCADKKFCLVSREGKMSAYSFQEESDYRKHERDSLFRKSCR